MNSNKENESPVHNQINAKEDLKDSNRSNTSTKKQQSRIKSTYNLNKKDVSQSDISSTPQSKNNKKSLIHNVSETNLNYIDHKKKISDSKSKVQNMSALSVDKEKQRHEKAKQLEETKSI